MHPLPKSSSLIVTILVMCVSYSTCNPARLSDHLKHLTGKILAINPNLKSPLLSAPPPPAGLSLPNAAGNAADASPSGHSVAKSLVSAISASSAKQHEIAQAVRAGRKITKKRGMFSSFLSFPKGLRAALPLFGIRPLVQSAASTRPASLIPAETMFRPSFLSPHSTQMTGQTGVPLAQFLESQTVPTTHYAAAHRPVVSFMTPPFLGHVPAAASSPHHHHHQTGDTSESLGISESLISALHHRDQEQRHRAPVRQQIQFIPLQAHQQPHEQQPANPHYQYSQEQGQQQQQQHQADRTEESNPNPNANSESEEAEKVMYVYVDEDGKTVATKVADMDIGPESALPDGYNIKAVGAPLPVSQQDQQQAQQVQQQQQHQGSEQQQGHQLAHDAASGMGEIREPESDQLQRPVLAGFANMHDITATPNPDPAPLSAYLQNGDHPRINPAASPDSAAGDLGTEPPVGIGIPVSMNDPRAGRIIFPGPEHKAKPVMTEDSLPIPDPIVDPEIPHSDPTQDMVFMLGDYNQYLKSQAASESEGQDAASAADQFLHSLTSSPASASEIDAEQQYPAPPEQHKVHLMRPPNRKQRILSTHGGWIPISRSPDHNKHVAIAILTHKDRNEKKEEAEEKQQQQQHQQQPQHEAAPEPEKKDQVAEGDVDKSESEPKVHFDDDTTSNLQDQPTRVSFSTSSSVSSSKELQRMKPSSESSGDTKAESSDEPEKNNNQQQPQLQKRSKYNVAAVFDHEFKPIFTSKSRSLDDIKDHELYSASKGSYGLRIPRSSDFEAEESEGSERIESSLVPSSSSQASSASSASFSLRSGLLSSQLEEALKKPATAGHFLVPVPGNDGRVKAYIVLSA